MRTMAELEIDLMNKYLECIHSGSVIRECVVTRMIHGVCYECKLATPDGLSCLRIVGDIIK